MNENIQLGCSDCRVKACHTLQGNYPEFCPSLVLSETVLAEAMKEYENPEIQKVAIAAAETITLPSRVLPATEQRLKETMTEMKLLI